MNQYLDPKLIYTGLSSMYYDEGVSPIYYDTDKRQIIFENYTLEQTKHFIEEIRLCTNLGKLFQANNKTIIGCLKQDNTHDKLIKDLESLVKEFDELLTPLKEKE